MKRIAVIAAACIIALCAVQGAVAEGKKDAPAAAGQPEKIKIFANFNPEVLETDTRIFAEAEKALGVKIEFEIPPSASYNERTQIMLAGGDYPQLVLFNDTNDKIYIDAVNSGAVLPIGKYVAASPNLQKYSYKVSWDAMKVKGDGEIYGMPRTSIARADGFIVRRDWLNKVGLGSIKDGEAVTLDQFTEILRRFSKNDPDGNGKNDTYGFAQAAGGDGSLPVIGQVEWAFDLTGWRQYSDEAAKYLDPKFSRNKDNYKRAIEYSAALWKEGLFDPDFPVVKREASIQRFKQGITGVIGEFAGWIPQYVDDIKKLDPSVELGYIVGIKNSKGVVQGGSFGTGTWGVWGVMNSAKKPEKVVALVDWLLGDQGWEYLKYGVEGVTFKTENGVRVPTADYNKWNSVGWNRRFVRRNDDPDFFIPLNMTEANKVKIKAYIATCIQQASFSMDRGYRPPVANDPRLIDYNKKWLEGISKMVVGADSTAGFGALLDGWYKNGGDEYVKQMNEFIAKSQ